MILALEMVTQFLQTEGRTLNTFDRVTVTTLKDKGPDFYSVKLEAWNGNRSVIEFSETVLVDTGSGRLTEDDGTTLMHIPTKEN